MPTITIFAMTAKTVIAAQYEPYIANKDMTSNAITALSTRIFWEDEEDERMSVKVRYKIGKWEMEAEGNSSFVNAETKALHDFLVRNSGKVPTEITVERKAPASGMKEETVVIYDDVGIPSVMRKFSRMSDKELFGGSDKPHPAFVIGGTVYDEIYISVYPNCEINGKPYSLPIQKLWTDITNDDAARACFSKGEGWHLMTAAEWGLVANICNKNGTFPHGNTANGEYCADPSECGLVYEYGRTLAGSGPATWTHNHRLNGIHDLCGNVCEMVRGLRMKGGLLEAAVNNDAALDIDLTIEGDDWHCVVDDEGKPICVSVYDGGITFTTEKDAGRDRDVCTWGAVKMDCDSEQLTELALYGAEPNAYLYVDSTEDEFFLFRGGTWHNGTEAGVFSASLGSARSISSAALGFRSAYFKKH